MTGPTHRQYSVTFAFLVVMVLYSIGLKGSNINIISMRLDTNAVNYYIALLITLPIGKLGAKFPDVDHEWEFVKDKTVPNRIINLLIHLTGGHHRSWQTHSWDIAIWFTVLSYLIPKKLEAMGLMSTTNAMLLIIISVGFSSGWISHLFSDMLNGVGVRLFCWCKKTVAFVPHKFLGIRFNTGEEWEDFNFFVVRVINMGLGVICLIYPLGISTVMGLITGRVNNMVDLVNMVAVNLK